MSGMAAPRAELLEHHNQQNGGQLHDGVLMANNQLLR